MRKDMQIEMCIDMRTDMCTDMCINVCMNRHAGYIVLVSVLVLDEVVV